MRRKTLTDGSIGGTLLRFALPTLFGSFFQYLYSTADAIIVERYVGKVGLAAVGGTTGVVINLLLGLFIGISAGSSIVIAQYVGAGDDAGTRRSLHTTAALTLCVGGLLMALGLLGLPPLLQLLNMPREVYREAASYLRIYFGGILGMAIYNFGSAVLRSLGDARRPLYALIACSGLNVALDLLFVGKLRWGVAGAAFATVFSQAVSAVYIIIVLCRFEEPCRLHPGKTRIHGRELLRILRIGLPCGLQTMVYAVSNLLMQIFVNRFGTDTIAAVAAYEKIESLYILLIEAVSVAAMTFCGQNYGARRFDRMKKGVSYSILLCVGITAAVSTALMLLTGQIAGLFVVEEGVREITVRILRCIAPLYFTAILVSILPAAPRSAGDSFWPIFITCAGICGFRTLFSFLGLQFWQDIRIIILSYPVSWLITSLIFLIYYKKSGWLERCIRRTALEQTESGSL